MLRPNVTYLLAAAVILIIAVLAVVLLLILEPVALPILQWLRLPTRQVVMSGSRHRHQLSEVLDAGYHNSTRCACARLWKTWTHRLLVVQVDEATLLAPLLVLRPRLRAAAPVVPGPGRSPTEPRRRLREPLDLPLDKPGARHPVGSSGHRYMRHRCGGMSCLNQLHVLRCGVTGVVKCALVQRLGQRAPEQPAGQQRRCKGARHLRQAGAGRHLHGSAACESS